LIAAVFYYAPFRWQNTFNYLFKQHFIETLLIYGVTYAFLAFKNRTSVAKQEKLQADFITVFKDKKHIPINIENVIFIQTNRPYISIHTLEQRYLSSTTLKQVLTTFKDTNLIRIHKSTVINIHHVKSYISRQNGDYDILMNNGITLRLSRTYARIFKEKMAVPPLGS
ncbi:MAG: LytTR family DNA-binding domain-containing protein, partial [Bacteroidota bacterium]